MRDAAEMSREHQVDLAADELVRSRHGSRAPISFVDNRPEANAQSNLQAMLRHSPQALQARSFQELANGLACEIPAGPLRTVDARPIQRMRAYDESEPLQDPRHFSTTDVKRAIDRCVGSGTAIPWWLKEQVSNYLRDELFERHQDMGRYNGGDAGHRYYFELIRKYVDLVESLAKDESDSIPTAGPALQLQAKN